MWDNQLYVGTVQAVYPPGDPQNLNRFQHEYAVAALGDNFNQIPMGHVIKGDQYGAVDEYCDAILEVGQKVLVAVLKDMSQPIIVSAIRNSANPTSASLGHFYRHRYRYVTTLIDSSGNHSVTSDAGPSAQVNQSSVVLDDSNGDSITLDKESQTITVNAGTWNVVVQDAASIQVQGDCSIQASGDVSVQSEGDVSVQAMGSATVEAAENVTVTAAASVSLSAPGITIASAEATISMSGGTITLGEGAAEGILKGDAFQQAYNSHVHSNGNQGAPTGPPITPLPASAISSDVKAS